MDIFGVAGFMAIGLTLLLFWCLISIDRKLNVANQYLAAIHKALTALPPEEDGEEEAAPKPAKKEKRKASP